MGRRDAVFGARHPLAALVLVCCIATPVEAQDAPQGLFGTLGGDRTKLADLGISLGLTDTESLFGNVSGGVKQGATLQGVTLATLQADTSKLFGLAGGTLYASALQIHGRSFSPYYLDNLQNVNTTEAENSTRLWELWYDQRLADGLLDLRLGQQSIDQEFMLSPFGGVFANMMVGWPILPTEDLYAGGPAYPLSSLAVRLAVIPSPDFTVQTAVFDDNPAGGPFDDDLASRDAGGVLFNLSGGALFIAEAKFSRPAAAHLPGSYQIGGWYDSGTFGGFDNDRNADASVQHHGNYGLYAMADQTLWAAGARTVNAIFRILGAPGDRNLISLSANAGITVTAPFPHRPDDIFGVEIGMAKAGSEAVTQSQQAAASGGGYVPVRGTETVIELTYAAQATPWLVVQPDVQYIADPGAGLDNPANPGQRLRNALAIGLRSIITF